MARSARHRALDTLLYQLRSRPAEAVLWPLPQRRRIRLGQAAEGATASAPSRREIRRAARERMAAQAHAMDQVLHPPGRHDDVGCAADRSKLRHLCRSERRRHIPDRTARSRDRAYRADRGEAVGVIGDGRRGFVPGGARVHAGSQGAHLPRRARCPYADRARLAALFAPQARPKADTALPALSHP